MKKISSTEIPELPDSLPAEVWDKFGGDPEEMGLRSIPRLDIKLADLKKMKVEVFLASIEAKYPATRPLNDVGFRVLVVLG